MRYPVDLVEEDNGTVTAMVRVGFPAPNLGGGGARYPLRAPGGAGGPAPGPTVALPALSVAKIGLYRAMREEGLGKAELARRLGRHLPQVDRILDLGHASRLDQVEAALHALGRELSVEVARAA